MGRRLSTNILLFINLVLILFISIRAGADKYRRPDDVMRPALAIRMLDPAESFYPDTLTVVRFNSITANGRVESVAGSVRIAREVCRDGGEGLTVGGCGMISVTTRGLPGEWVRYDLLQVLLWADVADTVTVTVRLGDLGAEAGAEYAERTYSVGPGRACLMLSLNDFKRTFRRLPLGEPVGLRFSLADGERLCLDEIMVARYEH